MISGPFRGMPPLFVPAAGDAETRARHRAAEDRLRPFYERGVLGAAEVHVAARLGRLTRELDPEALLGLAFAVRAPLHGHICAHLEQLDDSLLPDPAEGGKEQQGPGLPWPEDRAAWAVAIRTCQNLVRLGQEDRITPFVLDGALLYMDRYWRYQTRLAANLRRMGAGPTIRPHLPGLLRAGLDSLFPPQPGSLDADQLDRQKLGAVMAVLRPLSVISGGPGMGKTWTIRKILTLLFVQQAAARGERSPDLRVALAAPTGKAAARMKEAINEDLDAFLKLAPGALGQATTVEEVRQFLLHRLESCTLHRLLGWQPQNPSRFRHNAENPLPHQVVVVDETSMVDFAMMAKLVDAVSPEARLVLLGDRHQLASVEAGTVLADLCGDLDHGAISLSSAFVEEVRSHCGMDLTPHVNQVRRRGLHDNMVQLNKNYRFAGDSGIGAFARACLDGGLDPAQGLAVLRPDASWQDLTLLPRLRHKSGRLSEELNAMLVEGYQPYLEILDRGPARAEEEQSFHRRVLQAFERFRVLCALRRGPHGEEGLNLAVERLLQGEKIGSLHLSREEHYVGRPVLVRSNDYTVNRYNGDVGVVVRRLKGPWKGSPQVAFPGPGDAVEYLALSRLPRHQTVFAMTIHKSQGSQFLHALVVLPEKQSPVLTRELIYTGVTRAAARMTMVGDEEVLRRALARTVQRASGLSAELRRP